MTRTRSRAVPLLLPLLPLLPLLALAGCGSGVAPGATPARSAAPSSTASAAVGDAGGSATPSPTFPTPASVSPTGPPATVQVRLVAVDNQTTPCAGSARCARLGWTPALQHAYATTTCHRGEAHPDPDPHRPVVACSSLGEKYLLGPAELTDRDLAHAAAAYSDTETWAVDIAFTPAGARVFRAMTRELAANDQQYAIVVDGSVVAAPSVFAPSSTAQLTGGESGFTQEAAEQLAARLNEGAGTR